MTQDKRGIAFGICQRSGFRFPLRELVPDGLIPSLWVHPNYWEPPETRVRKPVKPEDTTVKHPAPPLGKTDVVVKWPLVNQDNGQKIAGFMQYMTLGEPVAVIV